MQATYTNFSGGQNNFAGPQAGPIIADMGGVEALMYAESSTNWKMSEAGLIGEAGYTPILSAAISGAPVIQGEFDFNGTTILCAGGKVYTVTGSSKTEIYPLGGTLNSTTAFCQFTEWDNGSGTRIVIICNGVDKPLVWDGSTCAQISFTDPDSIWNDARPQGAWPFRGRIFYWGDPTKPYRLYTPIPGSYKDFTNTNSLADAFDVDSGFGGVVTGVRALTDDFLVIYKQKAIRRLSGSAPFGASVDAFQIREVTSAFGCIAPRTLVGNDLEHYFLAQDGLRQLHPVQGYGDVDPFQPTYPIQDTINQINWTDSVIKNACAVYDSSNRRIWLSVPFGNATTNNKIFIYNVVTKSIDPRGTSDITAATLSYVSRLVNHGNYAGQIFKHGTNNDYNGGVIRRDWLSKQIAHLGIGRRKIYREMHLFAEADGGGDITVEWRVFRYDNIQIHSATPAIGSGSNFWDVGLWDVAVWQSSQQKIFKIKNLGRGNAIAFRFTNVSSTQLPKIRQMDLFYDVVGTARA